LIKIFIGFDPREEIVFHTCVSSIIHNTKKPVSIIPLNLDQIKDVYKESHSDGTNQFIYSRFLVPFLSGFDGISIFLDGDMIVNSCLSQLVSNISSDKAVSIVKHNYETKHKTKYWGLPNETYPRKNWSSVIVWNNKHIKNRILTPEFVAQSTGKYLHRFSWLDDNEIGDLDINWNWLVGEYEENKEAKILHYTLGAPCFKGFAEFGHSAEWFKYNKLINNLSDDH